MRTLNLKTAAAMTLAVVVSAAAITAPVSAEARAPQPTCSAVRSCNGSLLDLILSFFTPGPGEPPATS